MKKYISPPTIYNRREARNIWRKTQKVYLSLPLSFGTGVIWLFPALNRAREPRLTSNITSHLWLCILFPTDAPAIHSHVQPVTAPTPQSSLRRKKGSRISPKGAPDFYAEKKLQLEKKDMRLLCEMYDGPNHRYLIHY